MHEFVYANSKEDFKTETTQKHVGFISGNTSQLDRYFPKNNFHLIIGDLPYGIAHGNTSGKRNTSATRNPSSLLQECLPVWRKVLKPGGTVVVAWNSHLVPFKRMADIFDENGFSAFTSSPYDRFEHMVDKSIKRNIVVGLKASAGK